MKDRYIHLCGMVLIEITKRGEKCKINDNHITSMYNSNILSYKIILL